MVSREHIKINGHVGTWYVVDEGWFLTRKSSVLHHFLELEHETFGDEAAHIIVDDYGHIIMDDIWNGFDDLVEAGWERAG